MNVTDGAVRLLQLLESARIAIKLFLAVMITGTLAWLSHEMVQRVADELNVGTLPVFGFIAIGAYAVAVLVVESTHRIHAAMARRRVEANQRRVAREQAESLAEGKRAALREFLKHAPFQYLGMLEEFLDNGSVVHLKSGEVHRLVSLEAIVAVVEIDRDHAVYRLTHMAEPIVQDAIREWRHLMIDVAVRALKTTELEFIRLYSQSELPWEDLAAGELMAYSLYQAGRNVEHRGLISVSEQTAPPAIIWTIDQEAMEAISSVHGIEFVRRVIEVPVDRIAGSGASGSGAPPSGR